jgi:hypothetical protein
MAPAQIISLMDYFGASNTFAMGDHHDHVHVGYAPQYGTVEAGDRALTAILKPEQWRRLIDRIGEIENPDVRAKPSRFATRARKPASPAHQGE